MAVYLTIPYANKEIHSLITTAPGKKLQRPGSVQGLGTKSLN